jgi:hypothetical protein
MGGKNYGLAAAEPRGQRENQRSRKKEELPGAVDLNGQIRGMSQGNCAPSDGRRSLVRRVNNGSIGKDYIYIPSACVATVLITCPLYDLSSLLPLLIPMPWTPCAGALKATSAPAFVPPAKRC